MSVWVESLSTSQFEVCLRESRTFDGPHRNLVVVRESHSILLYFISLFYYFIRLSSVFDCFFLVCIINQINFWLYSETFVCQFPGGRRG